MASGTAVTPGLNQSASLWERPHIAFMVIACTFSWLFWIGSWLIAESTGAGTQLFNADLVWEFFFEAEVSTAILSLSLLSLVGAWVRGHFNAWSLHMATGHAGVPGSPPPETGVGPDDIEQTGSLDSGMNGCAEPSAEEKRRSLVKREVDCGQE